MATNILENPTEIREASTSRHILNYGDNSVCVSFPLEQMEDQEFHARNLHLLVRDVAKAGFAFATLAEQDQEMIYTSELRSVFATVELLSSFAAAMTANGESPPTSNGADR